MELLHRLAASYPEYQAALAATTGHDFIVHVSRSWSTDPDRAGKVLSVYDCHHQVFAANLPA
jgi:hypothetical protein